jgi:hypothetical protein
MKACLIHTQKEGWAVSGEDDGWRGKEEEANRMRQRKEIKNGNLGSFLSLSLL